MGKKRKAGAGRLDGPLGPNMDVGESKKRIRDFEDVADSDDEFHINRDKVLLDEEPATKRRRKAQEREEFLEPSDEEVLGYSGEEDEGSEDVYEEDAVEAGMGADASEEENEYRRAKGDEGEEMAWGTSKEDLYGADAIETEEQAQEEEAEALRLQKKQLQSMNAADYGFQESEWQDDKAGEASDNEDVVTERLPQLQISPDMGQAERLKMLKSRYPEFEPLSQELLSLRDVHADLLQASKSRTGATAQPNANAKLRAASAYLGSLTMYFALLTSPASDGESNVIAMSAAHLRDHPLMDTLVTCRELWQRARNLHDDDLQVNDVVGDSEDEIEVEPIARPAPKKAPRKSRAELHAEAAAAAVDARKAEKVRKIEADLADLGDITAPSRNKKAARAKRAANEDSDVGEEAPLTAQEAAEKAKRKKSLRFYTSQIAQKANKRGAAGRNAGGDDDIPYRERLKDRQARLNADAEKRGKRDVDARAELGGDSDEEDAQQARDVRTGAEDDEYYDLVAARTSKKKSDKAALAEAQRQAALQGGQVVQEESVGADGKRKISYAIEKNKGLTPHRKKDVRNPRVKKRKKYDEKKKKLSSIKPMYSGGEGRGGYGGELTGIKKGLVKSTKL